MLLTVLMPDQSKLSLQIADGVMVFDGLNFVPPDKVKYVVLYATPVDATSLPFDEIASALLLTSVRIRAMVLDRFISPVTETSPELVAADEPSPGSCMCFVTCKGTELRFVRVQET